MAITRRSAMPKQQATPPPPLPPIAETPPNNEQPSNAVTEPAPPEAAAATATAKMAAVSEYEQTREQRIKENRERLQKLGIADLSLQLKTMSSTGVRRTPKSQFERRTPLKSPSLGPAEPRRRSSRLQNAPPVTYVEPKEEKSRRNRDIVLEEGAKPEFYTEEQEKLLGNTEMPWTFFVDGYDAKGVRIYDPVNGKTCHQCRQKTLGQRTRCSKCSLVQGQFCGDCLYMRYGEHVVEANQNPTWICPPCRGICNCSLCRQGKGWAPTGALYRRISSLGYKSVAHYLMETRRAPPNVEPVSETQPSAKRSLPFEGMDVPSGNDLDDKPADEKTEITVLSEINSTPDTETNQIPKPVRRPGRPKKDIANAPDTETNQIPKPVRRPGRPKKDIASANGNVDDIAADEKTEISALSEINSTPDTETNQIPMPVRISGRPKKEIATATGKSVMEGEAADDEPVTDKLTPEAVRRSSRRSNKENTEEVENLVIEAEMADDVPMPDKTPEVAGRPRKRSKKETLDGGVEPVSEDVTEDGTVSEPKSPEVPNNLTDSVARRLRSRTST